MSSQTNTHGFRKLQNGFQSPSRFWFGGDHVGDATAGMKLKPAEAAADGISQTRFAVDFSASS